MASKILVFAAIIAIFALCNAENIQSVGVKGTFKCNDRPARDVTIKLYDVDTGINMDDLMGEVKTDYDGVFSISGHTDEESPIEPKLNIYSDCNDGSMPCQRKFSIEIPAEYITAGKEPEKFYDIGEVEIGKKQPGESRDCMH